MNKYWISLSGMLCILLQAPAYAETPADLEKIQQEIQNVRDSYERQIELLEKRVQELESRSAGDGADAAIPAEAPVAVSTGRGVISDRSFNPAISVILQGSLNTYSEDPDDYELPGFQLGGETGLPAEGLTLDETEVTASASVDPLFYAETTLGLHEDAGGTEIDIEEAFVDALSLPAGLGARFGRFYSGIGYLNKFHTHAWDFRDAPLAYRAMLNEQYRDDGIRVSWVAPTDLFLQLGGEMLSGNAFPGAHAKRDSGDARSLFAKLGGDLGDSNAWQAGLSALWVNPRDRDGGGHAHGGSGGADAEFSGDSNLYIADLVWKWAPNGNARQRNLILQAEYFYRNEDGDVQITEGANQALLDYDGVQRGWYAQAVYQFIPRWRGGIRYDRLSANNDLAVASLGGFTDPSALVRSSGFDNENHDPYRWSAMLDWTPSEFSRLRLQYNRDASRPDQVDNQWTLQYIMSLGSHGAHEF